jgi:tryptophan 2,3-dioxygenase
MTADMTYTRFLDLDRILAAQHQASGVHEGLAADNLRPAFKMLARMARAQAPLIQSWDVLIQGFFPELLSVRTAI